MAPPVAGDISRPMKKPPSVTEDSQLVRGPKALIEAMRILAEARGQSISYVWRQAAERYLTHELPLGDDASRVDPDAVGRPPVR